jgi:DNA-directed RNA polymerase specialized sigma24 family protein
MSIPNKGVKTFRITSIILLPMSIQQTHEHWHDQAFLLIQEQCEDDEVFNLFVKRHRGAILEFTENFVRKGKHADKITDDAFVLLRTRLGEQKDEEAAKVFLLIAARNACLSYRH